MSPLADETVARRPVVHSLAVASVERLTDDAVAITLEVPPELQEAYRFTHGQHVALASPAVGDDLRRSYSLCEPATSGVLKLAVKRLRGGRFSTFAHTQLRPGDILDVLTPSGGFWTPLDPSVAKRYVAIAAGSGITPILSIAATTLEIERESVFTLLYGNRQTEAIIFLEELHDLKNRYLDRFVLVNVLSREPREVELLSGRLDGAKLRSFLSRLIPPETVDEWFLCGPLAMVDELTATLREEGVPSARIHHELFHAEPVPSRPSSARKRSAAQDSCAVTIVLDGRVSTFELMTAGESILEATLRVRPDAPYACKGGVCGTCRARLVEGEVNMDRRYALENDEIEAGVVLACQSHPLTPQVTLDFDR